MQFLPLYVQPNDAANHPAAPPSTNSTQHPARLTSLLDTRQQSRVESHRES